MGHYDDIIEAREEKELANRARRACRSVEDQWFYENKFLPAKKIATDDKYRRDSIILYEKYKEYFE